MFIQARKITQHKKKDMAGTDGTTVPFVWTKKIEKDLVEGADIKTFSKKAEREKDAERLVRLCVLRQPIAGCQHQTLLVCM